MKYLISHEEFEQLIGRQELPPGVTLPAFTVIYFTATWCGACRRLDIPALEAAFPNVDWRKCDVDANNYTPGFCGVRSIPTFVAVAGGKYRTMFSSSETQKVMAWVKSEMAAAAAEKSS